MRPFSRVKVIASGLRPGFHPRRFGVKANIYTDGVSHSAGVLPAIEKIDWYSFLARPRLPSPSPDSLAVLAGASILVTGAGGSIGRDLSLHLASIQPRALVLLDSSEQALFRLASELDRRGLLGRPKLILGNVCDELLLNDTFAVYHPEYIFHAAAYKHVPLLEEQPLAAIANNTLATRTLARYSQRYSATRMILLSTDKAVSPVSILGASKKIAEQITFASRGVVLRLANVLGSAGSVAETFMQRILAGEPLVITNPSAERYFLTSEEAIDLLVSAAVDTDTTSVVVPNLRHSHSILSLAKFLVSLCPQQPALPFHFTRLRSGEKLHESLWTKAEEPFSSAAHGTFRRTESQLSKDASIEFEHLLDALETAVQRRETDRALSLVTQLVPGYTPSQTLQEALDPHKSGNQPA